jgi:serine/threonine protein kinase
MTAREPIDSTEHTNQPASSNTEETVRLSALGREFFATTPAFPLDAWQPPSLVELHAQLPQYDIIRLLGRGGMGAVYEGRQTALERQVAIKILPPELGEYDPQFVERFKNEARAMARLSHPGIITVHDFGETSDGLLYIVMEFVEGADIAQMISSRGALSVAEVVPIILQVCEALHDAHERGILHRDIKPSNIMVRADGVVKVADFGLAKVRQTEVSHFTATGVRLGTPDFMAPETRLPNVIVDRRADVYAVGVMFYQMLTGILPRGLFEMPSTYVPGLDPRYDTIISRALRAEPSQRYQTAAEMRQALLSSESGSAGEQGHGVGWFL